MTARSCSCHTCLEIDVATISREISILIGNIAPPSRNIVYKHAALIRLLGGGAAQKLRGIHELLWVQYAIDPAARRAFFAAPAGPARRAILRTQVRTSILDGAAVSRSTVTTFPPQRTSHARSTVPRMHTGVAGASSGLELKDCDSERTHHSQSVANRECVKEYRRPVQLLPVLFTPSDVKRSVADHSIPRRARCDSIGKTGTGIISVGLDLSATSEDDAEYLSYGKMPKTNCWLSWLATPAGFEPTLPEGNRYGSGSKTAVVQICRRNHLAMVS
ncbi:hypothetical protein DENSPDRAFT_919870 [Dentipellis sp. KUC8613]|nr:hypothetical protein DENSPDRAFT_919870 [Dentipellis sp. KUC8613]